MKFILAMLMAMVSIAFAQTTIPTEQKKPQVVVGEVHTDGYYEPYGSYYDAGSAEEEVEIFSGDALTVKRLLTKWLANNKGKIMITSRLQSGDSRDLVITIFYFEISKPADKKERK